MRMTWMLVLTATMAAMTARAEALEREGSEARHLNAVSIDALSPTASSLVFAGEHVVSERVSVGMQLGLTFQAVDMRTESEAYPEGLAYRTGTRARGIRLAPQARFFLLGRAPEGLWVGPQVGVSQFEIRHFTKPPAPPSELSGRSLSLDGAVLTGYSAKLGTRLLVQAAVGVGMDYSRGTSGFTPTETPPPKSVDYRSFLGPITQLWLGYAF